MVEKYSKVILKLVLIYRNEKIIFKCILGKIQQPKYKHQR
jgi:hypothetical protein